MSEFIKWLLKPSFDSEVPGRIEKAKEPFSVDELLEELDLRGKIEELKHESARMGVLIGSHETDFEQLSEALRKTDRLYSDIGLLLLDWEAETKILQRESLEGEELKDLLRKCGFEVREVDGKRFLGKGSVEFLPR